MQPTNTTTYNPFTGSAPASNDNAFQAAIDYLIANRQKPVFKTPGLFTKPAENNTDASTYSSNTPTTNISNVVKELFGDDYSKKRSDFEGGSGGSFGGGGRGGAPTANDVASASSAAGWAQNNTQALSLGLGAAFGPFGGLFGKYGVPAGLNALAENRYDSFLADQDARAANVAAAQSMFGGQIGTYSDINGNIGTYSSPGTIDAYDRDVFGVTGADLDAARGTGQSFGGWGGFDASGYDAGGWSGGGYGASHSDYGDTGYDGNW